MANLPPLESPSLSRGRKRDFESLLVTPSPKMPNAPVKKNKRSEVAPVIENLMTRLESTNDDMSSSIDHPAVSRKEQENEISVAEMPKRSTNGQCVQIAAQKVSAAVTAAASAAALAPSNNDNETPENINDINQTVIAAMRSQPTSTGEGVEAPSDDSDTSFVTVLEEANEGVPVAPSIKPRHGKKRKLPAAFRHCAGCTAGEEPASVWCCECARCLCTMCDNRMHDTDALDALRRPMCSHRVEIIIDGGGVPVLSPMLEMVVLAGAVVAFRPLLTGAGTMLNVEYFFESVCPIVQRIRRLVFRIDHALYPLVRGTLGAWCDTEDAFVKIFVDVWVRGVLTSTDSFALLIMKAPSTFGALIVVLAVAPLLAIPYAVVATVVRLVELFLFRNWMITRIVAKMIRWLSFFVWLPCRIAGWFCRSTVLGLVMDNDYRQHFHRRAKIPPKTGHRLRPIPSDGIEDISFGAITRVTRIFWYFHRKARRAIIGLIVTSVFLAVLVRVVLLSMPRCGSGVLSATAQQEMWSMLSSGEGDVAEAPPQCISVHALARKLAKKIGVETPDFDSLGDEGFVLAKLQDSTDDDYIDLTLRLACKNIGRHFKMYPILLRVGVFAVLLLVVFAGVIRRLAFWADLKRRYRYRHLRDEVLKSVGLDNSDSTDDESGSRSDEKGTQLLDAGGSNDTNANQAVSEGHADALKQLSIPQLMKVKMKMKPSNSSKQK